MRATKTVKTEEIERLKIVYTEYIITGDAKHQNRSTPQKRKEPNFEGLSLYMAKFEAVSYGGG